MQGHQVGGVLGGFSGFKQEKPLRQLASVRAPCSIRLLLLRLGARWCELTTEPAPSVGEGVGHVLCGFGHISRVLRVVRPCVTWQLPGNFWQLGGGGTSLGALNQRGAAQSLTPVAPGQGVSRQAAEQAVQKALDGLGMRGVVAPQVVQNTLAAGLGVVPPGVVPSGGASRGQVYLFLDGIRNQADAFRVISHELLHQGSKVQFTSNPDYITAMLENLRRLFADASLLNVNIGQQVITTDWRP